MVSAKGKEKVTDGGGKGKRKSTGGADDDKTGRKRKNRGVIQFFDEEAYDVNDDDDSSDDSMFDLEDLEDEFGSGFKFNNEPAKVPNLPFVKEEDMSEEELDRMLEERYKPGAGYVTHMEDGHDQKRSTERNIYVQSANDLIIWKVKCMVGRERFSAFCLMQKYSDMVYLGTKLQIVSACAVDHVKGFIFIEAEKQQDIYEACKGLSSIYSSRVTAVPNNELSRLLSVRSKSSGISEGMWARVKNGKYKGDLAQVVAVNHTRKKATVKLVPRIDLKAMAEKFGGGVTGRTRRTDIPARRLISSSELEEFRPLIQSRRDRDTNLMFEILDGMMLKDGYLYKKISIDSLSFWGIMPTEDELLKFEPSKKEESTDVQWLSQLFGEKENKKKEVKIVKDKGGGKAEASTSSCMGNNFEMHDLVFFNRKDFGVVIGSEKGDTVKVLKEGSEGPSVVIVKQSELKSASFDKKLFSVLDQHSNTLSVNDNVRILEGPLKDREGIVKKIYKGILFLCDESEQENNGYICVKAKLCEKVNLSGDALNEKGSQPGPSGFADISSSPKSPSSPDKSWQERDNKSNFKRDDNDLFSVGQSLRIRVGPLKGYRCRVLALRRSDVTVKLDSQQKILTVKSEHLSDVRERNSVVAQGDESGSIKPFDFLGAQDGARDWMDGAALSTEGDNWNAGGSTERSSWSAFPSSNPLLPKDTGSGDPVDNSAKEGAEDSSWQIKATPDQSSSWGAAAANSKTDGSGETLKNDSWGAATKKQSIDGDTSGSKVDWGQSGVSSGPETNTWNNGSDVLDKPKESTWENKGSMSKDVSAEGWGKGGGSGSTWGDKNSSGGSKLVVESSGWGNADGGAPSQMDVESSGWAKTKEKAGEDATNLSSWGNKQDGGSSWSKPDGGSSWKGESSWGKPAGNVNEGSGGDRGFGGWKSGGMGNRNETFDGGRGSGGGRRGRGQGRGGRDQYGRGGYSDQGQLSTEARYDGGSSDIGNNSSWDSGQAGGWGKAKDNASKDSENGPGWGSANQNKDSNSSWNISKDPNNSNTSGWGKSSNANEKSGAAGSWGTEKKPNDGNQGQSSTEARYDGGSSDIGNNSSWDSGQAGGWGKAKDNASKDSENGPGWGSANQNKDSKSSWNISKDPNNSNTSGWGKSSNANEESGAAGSWGTEKKPNEDDNNKLSWKTEATSVDDKEGDAWCNQKASDGNNSGWNSSGNGKTGSGSTWKDNGGSSTGWGQSNWSKNEGNASGGNQDSTWSSKGNWNSDNQDNFGDGGRGGGGWRGGRGGRGDRGGFRGGRGGSDRGGFGGRGGGYGGGRGGFGAREGSDRGGFGGRGGSDRDGGFHSRGGFRGRGRGGDWNNKGDDSNVNNKSFNSWGKGSNNDGEGWKSSGGGGSSWKNGDGNNNNLSKSWGQPKDDTPQSGSWKSGGGDSSWNQAKGDSSTAGEWGKSNDSNKDVCQNDTGPSGWGSSSAPAKAASSSWGAAATGDGNSSGDWKKLEGTDGGQAKDEGPSDGWGNKAASTSSWGNGGGKGGW
ncbi:hypothetical protein CASFOL_006050 [Castilleja foliolosa]|uniref:KOW domain-containing protein n=1 Tax=Castilleja foliolosa TaxID=1961234 RepID=A0ABD3E5T2_9LAMI